MEFRVDNYDRRVYPQGELVAPAAMIPLGNEAAFQEAVQEVVDRPLGHVKLRCKLPAVRPERRQLRGKVQPLQARELMRVQANHFLEQMLVGGAKDFLEVVDRPPVLAPPDDMALVVVAYRRLHERPRCLPVYCKHGRLVCLG